MGRPIPDILNRSACLDPRARKIMQALHEQKRVSNPKAFYLYPKDFSHIEKLLGGSGFDVMRGFRYSGIPVRAIDEASA